MFYLQTTLKDWSIYFVRLAAIFDVVRVIKSAYRAMKSRLDYKIDHPPITAGALNK